jgi:hypothetical protein
VQASGLAPSGRITIVANLNPCDQAACSPGAGWSCLVGAIANETYKEVVWMVRRRSVDWIEADHLRPGRSGADHSLFTDFAIKEAKHNGGEKAHVMPAKAAPRLSRTCGGSGFPHTRE